MPDDYYVSQHSGEEIDERLTAAHNAVRYDAAQTLTAAQKTQARANIAAAPDGFGLGLQNVELTSSDDLDNVMGNGWYRWGSSIPANVPTLINATITPAYCSMFMIDSSQIVVSINDRNNMAMRTKNIDGWTPWEYINPPLKPGVEYRTTERYNGKPVYVNAVSVGSFPLGGFANRITVNTGITSADVDTVVRWGGFGSNGGKDIIGFPATFGNDNVIGISGYLYKQESLVVYIQSSGTDFSAYSGTLWLAYTKTTN